MNTKQFIDKLRARVEQGAPWDYRGDNTIAQFLIWYFSQGLENGTIPEYEFKNEGLTIISRLEKHLDNAWLELYKPTRPESVQFAELYKKDHGVPVPDLTDIRHQLERYGAISQLSLLVSKIIKDDESHERLRDRIEHYFRSPDNIISIALNRMMQEIVIPKLYPQLLQLDMKPTKDEMGWVILTAQHGGGNIHVVLESIYGEVWLSFSENEPGFSDFGIQRVTTPLTVGLTMIEHVIQNYTVRQKPQHKPAFPGAKKRRLASTSQA